MSEGYRTVDFQGRPIIVTSLPSTRPQPEVARYTDMGRPVYRYAKRTAGFRSRERVQQLRAAWWLIRGWRGMLEAQFDLERGSVREDDFRRCCPHPPECRRSFLAGGETGWIDCDVCGRPLHRPRDGWVVWPVEQPNACTCDVELRTAVRAESERRRDARVPGVYPAPHRPWPTHTEDCATQWMRPDGRPVDG